MLLFQSLPTFSSRFELQACRTLCKLLFSFTGPLTTTKTFPSSVRYFQSLPKFSPRFELQACRALCKLFLCFFLTAVLATPLRQCDLLTALWPRKSAPNARWIAVLLAVVLAVAECVVTYRVQRPILSRAHTARRELTLKTCPRLLPPLFGQPLLHVHCAERSNVFNVLASATGIPIFIAQGQGHILDDILDDASCAFRQQQHLLHGPLRNHSVHEVRDR